jgi:hypothetical protein
MKLALALLLASAVHLSARELSVMGAAVEDVCPLLMSEAALVERIKLERSNPSGVVNLRTLHELGEALRDVRAQLRAARVRDAEGLRLFVRWAGKPIDVGFCEAWEENGEN